MVGFKTVKAKILGGFSCVILLCLLPMSLFIPSFIGSLFVEKQKEVLTNSGKAFDQLNQENEIKLNLFTSLLAVDSQVVDYTFLTSLSGEASLLEEKLTQLSKMLNLSTLEVIVNGSNVLSYV